MRVVDAYSEEGTSTAAVEVSLGSALNQALTVRLSFTGTANNGQDYDTLSTAVRFAEGQRTQLVVINPRTDTVTEGRETVQVSVVADDGYTRSGQTATVYIDDKGFVQDGYIAPLDDTLKLHSLPGAKQILYINFLGGDYYRGLNGVVTDYVTPYDIDNNEGNLSEQELINIQKIWSAVAEDFLPFNINVTTEKPPEGALTKESESDDTWGISVLVGDDPGYGFAWSGSYFSTPYDYPGYVSINNTFNGGYFEPSLIAQAVSHEAGHTMGLSHDGPGNGGYYTGHKAGDTTWLPIMGIASIGLSQWSSGDYATADNQQDDLAIIANATNGFGYRADDHANERIYATPLSVLDNGYGSLYAQGIIEKNTDVDWFRFTHTGGELILNISPNDYSPNLDIGAQLYDADFMRIAVGTSAEALTSNFAESLPAGEYYLKVEGVGTNADQGYSDYGSLGAYTIESGVGFVARYDFNGESIVDSLSGTSQFTSLSISDLSAVNLGSSSSADGWATYWSAPRTIDTTSYISFSITGSETSAVALSSLRASFYAFAGGSGTLLLRSSQDSFSSTYASVTLEENKHNLVELDLSTMPVVKGEVEFRLYMISSTGSPGFRYLTGTSYQYDSIGYGLSISGRVVDANARPDGGLLITGLLKENETLTVTSTLSDNDGMGQVSYQWFRNDQAIANANSTSLVLSQDDVGSTISVSASYIDGLGKLETVSATTSSTIANINDIPQGRLQIDGTAQISEELRASIELSDDDGLGKFSFQWLRDDTPITNAITETYTISSSDINTVISLRLSYIDEQGTTEVISSDNSLYVEDIYVETPVDIDDRDSDGISNERDAFPDIAIGNYLDSDSDGAPDECNVSCLATGMFSDSDDDNDGIADISDTFPYIPLGLKVDTDGDGAPDECDTICLAEGLSADLDDDNDGVLDFNDAYPLISLGGLEDLDGDGRPNVCNEDCLALGMEKDTDCDGDGILDINDTYPTIPLGNLLDTDADGAPNTCEQACLTTGMAADSDDDNDGIDDIYDAYPLVGIGMLLDTDNDGAPDTCDAACLTTGMNADDDDDNDGILDINDVYPLISIGNILDEDKDGDPDICDQECIALGMTIDDDADVDGDGIANHLDVFPNIAIGSLLDTDGDGAPDNCDIACQALGMSADGDDDNDNILDGDDKYPQIAIGTLTDLDNDGAPDICDSSCLALGMSVDIDNDSDNDGIADVVDAFPLVPIGLLLDTDGDGAPDDCDENCVSLGMTADNDDDNDGVLDVNDAYPLYLTKRIN